MRRRILAVYGFLGLGTFVPDSPRDCPYNRTSSQFYLGKLR